VAAEGRRDATGTGGLVRAVAYRFRATLGRRLGGYLAVTLLVGLVGGLALGAVAGARRTQSAYPTYLARARASQLDFTADVDAGASYRANLYSPSLTRALRRLPHVARVAAAPTLILALIGPSGRPVFPAALENEVETAGSVGGEFYRQDAVVVRQGRLPAPGRTDEFAISAAGARLLHWHVGQAFTMGAFTYAQLDAGRYDAPAVRFRTRLSAIVTYDDAVIQDAVDQDDTEAVFTPALTDRLLRDGAAGFPTYDLRLAGGAAEVPVVEREIIAALPPGATYSFRVSSVTEGEVERAMKPESIALGVFGLIALVATVVIAAQAVARSLRRNRRDLEVLRALGAHPALLLADALLGIAAALVVGAVLAGAVSVALSPLAPLGAVRALDPSPGFELDWAVVGVGAAVFVAGLGALALVLALATVWRLRRGERVPAGSSAFVANALRLGLPPSSVAGLRFAVERGGGDAVPVGSTLLGAVLAVTVVVATLTFGSGLGTLVSHPALYGWNWDAAVVGQGGAKVPALTDRLLARDGDVAAWTGYTYGDAEADGITVPVLVSPVDPRVAPPILSGHGLEGPHQVVLGATTLAELHKQVGQYLTLSYGAPNNVATYIPPVRLRIVGSATLPAVGNAFTLHVSMGTGAVIAAALEPPAFVASQTNPDPNADGSDIVVIRLRPGVAPAAGLASVRAVAATTTRRLASDPDAGGIFTALPVQQPAEIVNYKAMGSTPAVLASSLALGAVVALGLTLVAAVRRRRRDLALLRTIGFVQRQLAAVVAWQASVAAAVGVVVGVPAGIVVGRVLWSAFARAIAAVPRPTVPVPELVLVAGAALVLANVVALVPGRLAARTATAELFRAE